MATVTHYISGKCRWAKVFKPDEKYNKYSIEIGLTKDAYDKFKNTGLKNKAKEDEGLYWITLRRDPDSKVWVNGASQPAGAPSVQDHSGAPITATIGNGSEVTVKYTVYDYDNKFGKGKGSRLETVRIDTLVEYKKPEENNSGPKLPF